MSSFLEYTYGDDKDVWLFSTSLSLPFSIPHTLLGTVPKGVDLPRALRMEKSMSRQREVEEYRRRRMSDSSVSVR